MSRTINTINTINYFVESSCSSLSDVPDAFPTKYITFNKFLLSTIPHASNVSY